MFNIKEMHLKNGGDWFWDLTSIIAHENYNFPWENELHNIIFTAESYQPGLAP